MMGGGVVILSSDVIKALIHAGVIDKRPTSKVGKRATQEAFNQWMDESGRGSSGI
jgi:hypothetical protein